MMKQCTTGMQRSQRGYAMLGSIAAVGIFATAAVTTLGTATITTQKANNTSVALARAKQALISRAASDANHPGSLPCPDAVTNIPGSNVPNDGIADLLAGQTCPSAIGRLPWRTLGLPDLRDADGERLWYLLAPAYQDSPSKVINPGTSGQIVAYECTEIESATQVWPCEQPRAVSATPWVAVVFAPGKLLGDQNRSAAHANDYAQFLESYHPADPMRLKISGGAAHNDRSTAISPDDIFALVERRVANEIQSVLAKYYAASAAQGQARLPWPAAQCASSTQCDATPLSSPLPATARGVLPSDDSLLNQIMTAQGMAWFDHNHWRTTVSYSVDSNCAAPAVTAQCGGAAFASRTDAALPADTAVIGAVANLLPPATRAVLAFAGVAGGSAKTQIAFTLQ